MADTHSPIAVIGLGRFGGSVAHGLTSRGVSLLAIDAEMTVVQRHSETLRDVVCADSTDELSLRQLGLDAGWRAVVAIGGIQQSLLTITVLQDLGIEEIWAKAVSERHALLLRRMGAAHVVQPEADAGLRISQLLVGGMLDYLPVERDYSVAKTPVPDDMAGRALSEPGLTEKHDVRVIAVLRADGTTTDAEPSTVPLLGDVLVLWGKAGDLERFAKVV